MSEIKTIEEFVTSLDKSKQTNVVHLSDSICIQRANSLQERVAKVLGEGYSINELNGRILSIADRIFRNGSTHQELERMTTDFIIGVMEELSKLEQACQFKPEIAAIIGEALYIARESFPELIQFIESEGINIDDPKNHDFFILGMYQYLLKKKELSQHSQAA